MSQKNFIKEDFKILSTLSFVAKSWHMLFLKSRNLAKSSANRFRFETVLYVAFLVFLSGGYESRSRYW
ncbi:hypothetical protein [Flavobacterium pectinovorum]|uniref:Uncharacterized protein n=1 Tax=Flavobacterium pectinovorum TaxID=29533 RepID=A0A502EKZ3_9FLAO|nr:hypothetical protein [Flavobacterium pectinovorum]TPG38378.1 hypothetical protein EAH81_15710 [Flavobacterium pectinovorum]